VRRLRLAGWQRQLEKKEQGGEAEHQRTISGAATADKSKGASGTRPRARM